MNTSIDYYAVLGVDSQASTSAIKAAFKKLALQYHPDVYKGADAQERMRGLLQAYQTLSDPVARREYDALRTGEDKGTRVEAADRAAPRNGSGLKHDARYAFPEISAELASPLWLKLDNISYQLSPAQAESLRWEGMLRGVTFDPAVTASDALYCCHRCHHHWSASASTRRGVFRPLTCPACQARDWAEYLLLRCTHCHAVFESKEIHDPLRGEALYHPYELFPLCPHCRRSQWCPAENGRVASLRAAAARRSVLLWSSVIGVCVLLVAIVALAMLK